MKDEFTWHPDNGSFLSIIVRWFRNAALLILAFTILTMSITHARAASTSFICSLVGAGTHNGSKPTSTHQPKLKLYGTDLGFSFKHKNETILLFGDTWNTSNSICQAPKLSDDALGRINLSKDSNPDDCLDIHFPTNSSGDLHPLRVLKNNIELNMGALRTPITGWSDNINPYGYFSGNSTISCNPNQKPSCPDGLLCSRTGNFCTDPGSTGFPQGNPAGERHIAVLHQSKKSYSNSFANSITTKNKLPDFKVGYTFATNKFLNATSRVIGKLDEDNRDENIYKPTERPKELLMWGRPAFLTIPETSDIFLLHHSLNTMDGPGTSVNWQPRYFAGLDSNDDPVWTNDQIFATPIIAEEELLQVLQFSIAWVEPIKRFVMIYSGRLPRIEADNTSGIYLRTAKHPWGPWSNPKLIWNPITNGAYDCPGIMYSEFAAGKNCPKTDPYRPNWGPMDTINQCPNQSPNPNGDFGVEYGVNILDNFTKPGLQINSAVIYWNMSTWNPYRVVLMKTKVDASVIAGN